MRTLKHIMESLWGTKKAIAAGEKKSYPVTLPITESGADLLDNAEKEDGGKARQEWSNPIEFLLSCISMSVGLGNVWRFPFTAYENGGGAFLIPYLVVLMFIGRPFYLLELGLGQFSSSGCVKVWDLVPPFAGIGYAQSFATFVICSYYCVLIALSLHYLFASFATELPWTVCDHSLSINGTLCVPSGHNISELDIPDNTTVVASSEQYFKRAVLKENADLTNGIGLPDPALLGCLLLCWVLVFLTLRKGVASSGKVAYFTAIFPYTVLLTMLVKGLTLPGAMEGIVFLFTPQWHRLYDPKVWYAAVTQSFYSLSIGFGTLTTFSSYNKFRHNIYRDATIVSVADTFTSVLAGVITFSILGHLAHELQLPVSEVVKSGAGLAFISYPEVIATFDYVPQLFAVLFFLMLATLGLGSASGLINTCITILSDDFHSLSKNLVTSLVCLLGFCAGVVYTTPGGQAVLELVDYYGGSLMVLFLAVVEIIALAWIYRTCNLLRDLEFMLGMRLGVYWRVCWSLVVPVSLTSILAYTLAFYKPVEYAGSALPTSAQISGWMVTLLGLLTALIYFIHSVFASRDRKTGVFSPLLSWGPRHLSDRIAWQNAREVEEDVVEDEMVEIKFIGSK